MYHATTTDNARARANIDSAGVEGSSMAPFVVVASEFKYDKLLREIGISRQ